MNPRDTQILRIALPSIVSNITVPLLGMIDVAIVGHMGSPVYIGAVAVGSMIFNLVYWVFAFLRMGSSGLTSQALGRRDLAEVTRLLVRSMTIALGIAALLLMLQVPLKWLMFWFIAPTADVAPLASDYYNIVIWGAPAMLGLYSLSGWYVGMQNTRIPMLISIGQNVVNILASLTLVYGLGMKIEGVALGTVIAQYAGFLVALGLLLRYYGRLRSYLMLRGTFVRRAMRQFFNVNRDIFLRTLCLVSVNLYFTSAGARHGAVILSVNTILMQLYLLYSYFMDGFAYAGEALGGRAYGARNAEGFSAMLRRLTGWASAVALLFTLVYACFGMGIIGILTDEPQVMETARKFVFWVWLVPLASTTAFILDGIFIGITATRGMLLSSFLATLLFFALYFLTRGFWGNHALWLAMIGYLAMRGIVQAVWLGRVHSGGRD
ncbi:MAG: MATE family efflux transporter [Bacteroidaceae bacterium]|nr:MATE family efflux transporter [Bacteroidaceae bacterium]